METSSRRSLRQKLGQWYLRDTIVGETTGCWGATASFTVWAANLADLTLSGEQLYQRAVIRLLDGSSNLQDVRVASFNTGSGAFLTLMVGATTIASGTAYEIHTLLSPSEKDQALTYVSERLRTGEEYPINAIDGLSVYTVDPFVRDIQNVRIAAYPVESHNMRDVAWWKLSVASFGNQYLEIRPAPVASERIVVDAIVNRGLETDEQDTIYLPNEDWLLSGAAAHCYWLLERRAPAQNVKPFQDARRELALRFQRLSRRYQPHVERKIQLDTWS